MTKKESNIVIPIKNIEEVIYLIRGQKVILDQDLATLYSVTTGAFNRSMARNQKRFPDDFAFRLTRKEWDNLKCQNGIARFQWGGRRTLPIAFTEHGVAMAANLLKSNRAIKISVEIVRTFIKLRNFLDSQKELVNDLSEIKSYMLKRFNKSDREFRQVWNVIKKLTEKPKNQRKIGFDLGRQSS